MPVVGEATVQVTADFSRLIKQIETQLVRNSGQFQQSFAKAGAFAGMRFSNTFNQALRRTFDKSVTNTLSSATARLERELTKQSSRVGTRSGQQMASSFSSAFRAGMGKTMSVTGSLGRNMVSGFRGIGSRSGDEFKAGFEGTMKGFISTFVGQTLSRTITRPFRDFVSSSFEVLEGFDLAIRRTGIISDPLGLSPESVARLDEMAQQLGATTTKTSTQVAEGMAFLAQTGLDVNEILRVTPDVVALAEAGLFDMGRAADIATNVMNAFGKDVSELGEINDIIANTFTSSNTSIEQLASALKFAGPPAQAIGGTLEEVAAAIGVLGDAGVQAGTAGRSLRFMFNKLVKPTTAANEALEAIGITASHFFDKDGDFRGIAATLTILEAAIDRAGLTAEERLRVFSELFGVRFGSNIALLGDNIRAVEELTASNEASAGLTAKIQEQQLAGMAGVMIRFSSALDNLRLTFARVLEPLARPLITLLTEFIRSLIGAPPIILRTAAAFGTLLAVLGPLMTAIGTLKILKSSGILPSGFLAVNAVLTGLVAALGALGAAVAFVRGQSLDFANSLDFAFGRIRSAVMPILEEFRQAILILLGADEEQGVGTTLLEKVQSLAKEIGDNLAPKVIDLGFRISAFIKEYQDILTAENIVAKILEWRERFLDAISRARDAISKLKVEFIELRGQAARWLEETSTKLRPFIDNMVKAGEAIREAFGPVLENQKLGDILKQALLVVAALKGLAFLKGVFKGVAALASAAFIKPLLLVAASLGTIWAVFNPDKAVELATNVARLIHGIWDKLIEIIVERAREVFGEKVLGVIETLFNKSFAWMRDELRELINDRNVRETLEDLGKIALAIVTLVPPVIATLVGSVARLLRVIAGLWQSLKDFVMFFGVGLTQIFVTVANQVNSIVNTILDVMSVIPGVDLRGAKTANVEMEIDVTGAAENFEDSVGELMDSLFKSAPLPDGDPWFDVPQNAKRNERLFGWTGGRTETAPLRGLEKTLKGVEEIGGGFETWDTSTQSVLDTITSINDLLDVITSSDILDREKILEETQGQFDEFLSSSSEINAENALGQAQNILSLLGQQAEATVQYHEGDSLVEMRGRLDTFRANVETVSLDILPRLQPHVSETVFNDLKRRLELLETAAVESYRKTLREVSRAERSLNITAGVFITPEGEAIIDELAGLQDRTIDYTINWRSQLDQTTRELFDAGAFTVTDRLLASGGLVNEATRAIIGEGGPELVVPLSPNMRDRAQDLVEASGLLGFLAGGRANTNQEIGPNDNIAGSSAPVTNIDATSTVNVQGADLQTVLRAMELQRELLLATSYG